MQTFYIKVKPLNDRHIIGRLNAHIYGTFEVYERISPYRYMAMNMFGVSIHINVKTKITYVMNDGDFVCYGRITEFCRTEFGTEQAYHQCSYHRARLEAISRIIKSLEKEKKTLIQIVKEDYYGKNRNSNTCG